MRFLGLSKLMAVKLALDEKQEILRLYRESDAATTQLAKQFGISTSTVLRLLQELIPADEYRLLVSQKQAKSKRGSRTIHDLSNSQGNFQINQLALIPDDLLTDSLLTDDFELPLDDLDELDDHRFEPIFEPVAEIAIADDELDIVETSQEDQDLDSEEDEDDLVDEDDLDIDDLDADDFLDDDVDSNLTMFDDLHGGHSTADRLEILPLDEADLPIICYIVVDRIAEIITRPLKDFKDLGAIPPEEALSKTIPIFDNHRVARRFSHHNQRVIKFPSDLIHITSPKLVQKGITRILFSGQVYTLC